MATPTPQHNTCTVNLAVISVTAGIDRFHVADQSSRTFQDEQTLENLSATFGRGSSVQLRRGRSREAPSQASSQETTHSGRTAF